MGGSMRIRLFAIMQYLSSSFWFLPMIMILVALILGVLIPELDRYLERWGMQKIHSALYSSGAEEARIVMETVASSMINVAGIVFSITLVALSLAANQFGSRLLHSFMRDKINQMILGLFLATYVYCLTVLRMVRWVETQEGIPQISVTFAILLAVCNTFFLIYFIHHLAEEIQSPNVLMAVSRELDEVIDLLYPEEVGQEPEDDVPSDSPIREIEDLFKKRTAMIKPSRNGYIQLINTEMLMNLAKKKDVVVKIKQDPGRYVLTTDVLMQVWPQERVDETLIKKMQSAFTINSQRTIDQDVIFGMDLLVEVALRALSPSLNDSFTAMQCLDWLSHALIRMGDRKMPSPYRMDDTGQPRIIAYPASFESLTYTAFNPIRQNCQNNPLVMFYMLETIRDVLYHIHRPAYRSVLLNHAFLVHEQALRFLKDDQDLNDLEERYQQVLQASEVLS